MSAISTEKKSEVLENSSQIDQKIEQTGRNEPCPCKSGKKYKRCCGVNAAPKLSVPQAGAGTTPQFPAGFDPNSLSDDERQQMVQFAQAFQRLPKGQLQRLQAIMQKAMSGKDVTREAQELENSLPPDFQEMLKGFKMPNMPGMPGMPEVPEVQDVNVPGTDSMSEEEARAIVAKAAQEGKISQDQAQTLLEPAPSLNVESKEDKGISKFWKKFSNSKGNP